MTGWKTFLKHTPALAALTVLLLGAFSSVHALPGWTVINSDDTGLSARWSGGDGHIDTTTVDGRETYRISFTGTSPTGREGGPVTPVASALFAVPPGTEPVVSVSFSPSATISGVLTPYPTSSLDSSGFVVESFHMNDELYASPTPGFGVDTTNAGVIRGIRLVNVTVRPLQYIPGAGGRSGRIRYSTDATVTIRFVGNRRPSVRGPRLPSHYEFAVLNADRVPHWGSIRTVSRRSAVSTSPFSSGTWARVLVGTTGMYRLSASELTSNDSRFNDAELSSLAMFSGFCRMLPRSLTETRPDPTELTLVRPRVHDLDGDGRFNGDDYLLFYGKGPKHWWYDPSDDRTRYENNVYSRETVYWIGLVDSTALHAQVLSGAVSDASAQTLAGYWERSHEETETRNFDEPVYYGYVDGPYSGLHWEWRTVPANSFIDFQKTIYNMADARVRIRVAQLGGEGANIGSDATAKPKWLSVRMNGEAGTITQLEQHIPTWGWERLHTYSTPRSDVKSITITVENTQTSDVSLDFFEVEYLRQFVVRNDLFDFFIHPHRSSAPDRSVIAEISDVRDGSRLFEVTDGVGLVEYQLPAATISATDTVTRVQLQQNRLTERHYILTTEDWLAPVRIEAATPTANLHAQRPGVDYLVITHPDFSEQARRLADWRETGDTLRTYVATTEDIYDEFAVGMFDPAAIRDFIRYAYENWRDDTAEPELKYVVLFGDGQFDFRNLTRFTTSSEPHPGNWIPPHEDGPVCSDDWYGAVGDNPRLPELQVGRFCITSEDEARYVVDKIIQYENGTDRGAWQNEALFVSDDEYGENSIDPNFVSASETLARLVGNETVVKKLYTIEYTEDAQGEKPEARSDLLELWNRGAGYMNYIGHGNYLLWSHEHIFKLTEDLSLLENENRLPVVTTLTCSAGHFDNPDAQSLAEELVNHPAGGAIAVAATTRRVTNTPNVKFGRNFIETLYSESSNRPRLGDAFWTAKLLNLASTQRDLQINTSKFALIGDPATRVAFPELPVRISMNTDTLRALQPVTISGAVLTPDGSDTLRSFDGDVLVHLFDSFTRVKYQGGVWTPIFYYRKPGAVAFRSRTTVENGLYSVSAIIPREVIYGGTNARAVAQVWNDDIDGVGSLSELPISDTYDPDLSDDGAGPEITFTNADEPGQEEPLIDGSEIAAGECVRVWISDPAGINLTGEVGHRLLARIDGEDDPVNLTDRFVNWNSATSGWVDVDLSTTRTSVQVTVEAWDNWNNFSSDSLVVRVSREQDLTLNNIIAYPNPMDEQTTFTWVTTGLGSGEGDATIKVYSITGRLVDTIVREGVREGPAMASWSPHRTLANGVYLYQISVRRRSDGNTARAVERLAVLGS